MKQFLLKHVLTLQDAKKSVEIKWKNLKKCKPSSNISKNTIFFFMKKSLSLVKKSWAAKTELARSCPHRNGFVPQNFRVTLIEF